MNTTERTPIVAKNLSVNDPEVQTKDLTHRIDDGHVRSGNIPGSIFNLTNTVIGAGVLAYPYAYLSTGLVTGIIATVFIVLLSCFSLAVLAYASSKNMNAISYQEIVNEYLGKFWKYFSECLFVVNLTGACITYLIIVGDCLTPFFIHFAGEDFFLSDRKVIIAIISCILVFPLILFREVNKLWLSSLFACIGVIYLAGMFLIHCIYHWSKGNPFGDGALENLWFNKNLFAGIMPQAFISIPLIAFSFQGIELICTTTYYELKNPKLWKITLIIFFSLIFSVSFYIVIGIMGFLRFGLETAPNVLVSFGPNYIPSLIAMFFMGMTVTFSYPLFFFAERLAVYSFFYPNSKRIGSVPFFVITVILFVTSAVPAVFLRDISEVLGVIGSVGAISFIFIFPMFILIILIYQAKKEKLSKGGIDTRMDKFKRIMYVSGTVFIIVVALILLVAGNTVSIVKIVAQARGLE